jgi:hypothetical protein
MANNKIEILRSVCFTEEDLEDIQNLKDEFTEKEIEFMIEFKKIYELGLNQLTKFINKIDEEGKDLEPWDIEYYINLLFSGPLGNYTRQLSKDKKYFVEIPDILGVNGNNEITTHNTTLFLDQSYPLGAPVDIYNRAPDFIRDILKSSTEIVERVFRSSLASSIIHDNTLPIMDKSPQLRYSEEQQGAFVKRSNACYLIKDSHYRVVMKDTRQAIFDKVKEIITEEHYRIFEYRKKYSPFNQDENQSTSKIYEIEKKVIENDKEKVLILDIMGDIFDQRSSILKVETPEKTEEFVLNSVEGQFGSEGN